MSINRWDYSKSKSNYHFDSFKNEDANPPFKILGIANGALAHELQHLLKIETPEKNSFSNRLKVQLNKEDPPYTLEMDLEELKVRGLPEDHSFFYNLKIEQSPLFQKICQSFGMTGWGGSIHLQYPGQTFPYHIDEIPGIKKNDPNHWLDQKPEAVARFEVQLLDWEPGHIWSYGNTYWKQWKSGEIGFHEWRHIPHGTANISRSVRATLQVTGFVTESTLEIIRHGYNQPVFA